MKPYLHTPPDRLWPAERCQQAVHVSGEDCFSSLNGELNAGRSIFNPSNTAVRRTAFYFDRCFFFNLAQGSSERRPSVIRQTFAILNLNPSHMQSCLGCVCMRSNTQLGLSHTGCFVPIRLHRERGRLWWREGVNGHISQIRLRFGRNKTLHRNITFGTQSNISSLPVCCEIPCQAQSKSECGIQSQ